MFKLKMGLRQLIGGIALATLAGGALMQPAHAGRSCQPQAIQLNALSQGLALAERTVKKLDESGAQVVVLARVGQDLQEYGLRFSHLGFAYKEGNAWRVVHKLNLCGTDQSSVYREGVADFFMDSPYQYIAGVMPLRADVAQKLMPILKEPYLAGHLHTRAYSMLAYPWATDYQQSNQWAIETLAASMGAGVGGRASAQAWLKNQRYEPTELNISTMERLGARMTAANISFDDHPSYLRFTNRIRTVTVDSVMAWLQRTGYGDAQFVVR